MKWDLGALLAVPEVESWRVGREIVNSETNKRSMSVAIFGRWFDLDSRINGGSSVIVVEDEEVALSDSFGGFSEFVGDFISVTGEVLMIFKEFSQFVTNLRVARRLN